MTTNTKNWIIAIGGEDAENRLLFNQPLIYPLLRCSSVFNRRHHTPQQHCSSISQSLVYLWVRVEKEKPQICVHIQCLSMTQVCLGCKCSTWILLTGAVYFVVLCVIVYCGILKTSHSAVFCGIRLVFCHRSCFSSNEHLLHAVIMTFAGLCWQGWWWWWWWWWWCGRRWWWRRWWLPPAAVIAVFVREGSLLPYHAFAAVNTTLA